MTSTLRVRITLPTWLIDRLSYLAQANQQTLSHTIQGLLAKSLRGNGMKAYTVVTKTTFEAGDSMYSCAHEHASSPKHACDLVIDKQKRAQNLVREQMKDVELAEAEVQAVMVFEGHQDPLEPSDEMPYAIFLDKESLKTLHMKGCRDAAEAWHCLKETGATSERTTFDPLKHYMLPGRPHKAPQSGSPIIAYRLSERPGGGLHGTK